MNCNPKWTRFGGRFGQVATVALLVGATAAGPRAAQAQTDDEPMLNKNSVRVGVYRETRYWPPNAKEYINDMWSWMPRVEFEVRGPVEGGSQFYVDVTKPDGAAWLHLRCPTQEIRAHKVSKIENPRDQGAAEEKWTTIGTGVYGFKIRLTNALSGGDQVLFTGHFRVLKFHKNLAGPNFKNAFEYYVDHDWELPIGQVWLSGSHDKDAPILAVATWIKNQSDTSSLAAYLFYNGKQVGSTKAGGDAVEGYTATTFGMDSTDPTWKEWIFQWYFVHAYNKGSTQYGDDSYFMDKHPGEYTVKVLRKGDLCRVTKFTIGDDGKPVDNGIATSNHVGTKHIIIPVQVLGTQDGPWNKWAYKTEAFYGNPMSGFEAP